MKRVLVSFAACVVIQLIASPVQAELVFFTTGRFLSVKSHRLDGESLVLNLRSGGELMCDRSIVMSIEPDEVPYPDPAPEAVTAGLNADGTFDASVRYAKLIDNVAAEHGVDARLVKAIIQVESAFQERARSRKGAMGLMQLMPETARQYAVADPYEPRSNIEAGIKHLKGLMKRMPNLSLALAAYNAGEAAVQRYRGMPPYAETRDYVTRILRLLVRPTS
jgi:soluble lytic murein transglycosylase-like protein